jgi:hypothetical protein
MSRGTKPAILHVPPSSSSQRYVKKETNQLSPVKKRIKENKDHYIGKLHLYTQCCGSGMFIPDPTFFHLGSGFFSSRIRIKESKYFKPKRVF